MSNFDTVVSLKFKDHELYIAFDYFEEFAGLLAETLNDGHKADWNNAQFSAVLISTYVGEQQNTGVSFELPPKINHTVHRVDFNLGRVFLLNKKDLSEVKVSFTFQEFVDRYV